MTEPPEQFRFVEADPAAGAISLMPMLPLTLARGPSSAIVNGLLDTGAAINVLPHSIGLRLGAVWEQQTTSVQLTGNMARTDARVLIVSGQVRNFRPVRLAFAWAASDAMPVILGQTNFFQEFDVCFFRAREVFEVRPRSIVAE
jgi:hypothetical protein